MYAGQQYQRAKLMRWKIAAMNLFDFFTTHPFLWKYCLIRFRKLYYGRFKDRLRSI